jgi:putative ABC transport system ATP-binding protein
MAEPFIRIRGLKKAFLMGRETVNALAGIDLDIERNSFTVIMGPSGSGKSTLLYIIGGLDRPTGGKIEVNGQAIDSMDENALAIYRRRMVGFIFQSFNLLASMSALENVAFPMRFSGTPAGQRRKRAMELLTQVGLANRAYHKPTELSGGQQQRVAIARSMVNDPQLVVGDEPTGNLDTGSGNSIMQILADLHKAGRTVVVVTHDPRMTRYASHTVRLLDGRVVSEEEYNAAIALAEAG